jgi:restriction system protein
LKIYSHKEYSDPKDVSDNPHSRKCLFCNGHLSRTALKDIWSTSNDEIEAIHENTKIQYKEVHGLEDYYLNLRLDTQDVEVWIDYCCFCGWWRIIKDVCICAEEWQIWDIFFGCVGALKIFSVNDLSTPLAEIRSYLVRNYERRFSINPRLFEEVVGSVFKSIGYHTHVTGYSNDGGIDVVLSSQQNSLVGVQVKRHKNKIKVEQIRSFAGALILGGYTKGIFVTTSEYQPGAIEAAKNCSVRMLPIELINASKFYDALKLAQKKSFDTSELYNVIANRGVENIFFYGWDTPRNSL